MTNQETERYLLTIVFRSNTFSIILPKDNALKVKQLWTDWLNTENKTVNILNMPPIFTVILSEVMLIYTAPYNKPNIEKVQEEFVDVLREQNKRMKDGEDWKGDGE